MAITLDPKPSTITVEEIGTRRKKLGDHCDLSNEYVDVVQQSSCGTYPGGRDHQLPGYQRSVTCSSCGTSFSVDRYYTTGGFNTVACPTCGHNVGYMGSDGVCQSYACSGSSCSSCTTCPTKRVIDECDLEVLNNLICQLRAALKDGNTTCYAFSAAELSAFLDVSLSEFNGTPMFTYFTWKTIDLRRFLHIIVEGALLQALGAQSLIEAGREFTVNDNGISFTPAQVSAALQNQFSARFSQYKQDLNFIKENFKASPTAVLSYQSLLTGGDGVGGNPAYSRLRHLRGRRVF